MDPPHPKSSQGATPSGEPGGDQLPADLVVVLRRLDADLGCLYGELYGGLVLYGSYARGEADEGSDVDLLLLLEGQVNPARELKRAQEVKWPVALEASYTISVLPVSTEDYERSGEPFLSNARREGIPIP